MSNAFSTSRAPPDRVLPPRRDAGNGESFPGDYHYNPPTNDALPGAPPPRSDAADPMRSRYNAPDIEALSRLDPVKGLRGM